MPLDHYVSQVHLRNFYAPSGNFMFAMRKRGEKPFKTAAHSVCRIEDGSTNRYLRENRAVEEILKIVEPAYNAAVASFRANKPDQRAIFSIAGFLAYIVTCSPTAMRVAVPMMKKEIEVTAKVAEKHGLLPRAPAAFGGKTLPELLAAGTVKLTVDPKYPQAVGTTIIPRHISIFGNSRWEILHNDLSDSPFLTSDFPAAIEATNINMPVNRVVPLAPDLAVRILPDLRLADLPTDHTFSNFKASARVLRSAEVRDVNRLIVRCAEDTVFFREQRDWIAPFVQRNRHYGVVADIMERRMADGYLIGGRVYVGLRSTPPSTPKAA